MVLGAVIGSIALVTIIVAIIIAIVQAKSIQMDYNTKMKDMVDQINSAQYYEYQYEKKHKSQTNDNSKQLDKVSKNIDDIRNKYETVVAAETEINKINVLQEQNLIAQNKLNKDFNTNTLNVAGNLKTDKNVLETNKLRFSSAWSGFPDSAKDQSEISNDATNFKQLMIVGNKSAGAERRVGVWDRLDVNGSLNVNGNTNMNGIVGMNDHDLRIRAQGDGNHGIGYRGDFDGTFVWGCGGGGLGTECGGGGAANAALTWDRGGNINIKNSLNVAGNLKTDKNVLETNKLRFSSAWSGFPDSAKDQSEISNDATNFKQLMIVGNKSAGAERRVGIWDRLDVNGSLNVNGGLNVNGNTNINGIMGMNDHDLRIRAQGDGNHGIGYRGDFDGTFVWGCGGGGLGTECGGGGAANAALTWDKGGNVNVNGTLTAKNALTANGTLTANGIANIKNANVGNVLCIGKTCINESDLTSLKSSTQQIQQLQTQLTQAQQQVQAATQAAAQASTQAQAATQAAATQAATQAAATQAATQAAATQAATQAAAQQQAAQAAAQQAAAKATQQASTQAASTTSGPPTTGIQPSAAASSVITTSNTFSYNGLTYVASASMNDVWPAYIAALGFSPIDNGKQWYGASKGYSSTTGVYSGSINTTVNGANVAGNWLQMQYPYSFAVKYYILPDASWTGPYSWVLAGSTNNGSTWTQVDAQTSTTAYTPGTGGINKTFNVNSSTLYSCYRIIYTAATKNWGGMFETSLNLFSDQSATALSIPITSGLIGYYDGESWNGSQWLDKSGNNYHAAGTGVNVGNISNVANSLKCVYGGVNSSITWPATILPSTYTMFHITRWNGGNKRRIIQSAKGDNWLSGFWNGQAGVAYHSGWVTVSSGAGTNNGDKWILSTDQNNLYRSQGIDRTVGAAGGPSFVNLGINVPGSAGGGETSDWACAAVIVYNRTLSLNEMITVESWLNSIYSVY